MKGKAWGVLLMAYGTPQRLEEVEAYYTHIRRGKRPDPAQLQDLLARYKAIGGLSPLWEITRRQAEGVARLLQEQHSGLSFRVYVGMKHASPFIGETVQRMAEEGIEQAVGLVLAPHYSSLSVGSYLHLAQTAAEQAGGPRFAFVRQWHLEPRLLAAWALRLQEALSAFPEEQRADIPVIFTAHSLPQRILASQDPYPQQLAETARAVAERVGHQRWLQAWQSAGRTPEPWLGPDIGDVLRRLHEEGERAAVICPLGFVADHLEILYDIDIACQRLANAWGMHLVRTRSLNADPDFLTAVVQTILHQVEKGMNVT